MAQERKRLQSVEKDDRISDLPDPLIHHILSFLPSTKQAIQTGILSKRWRKQWTQVPILIFDSAGMSQDYFLNFVENTLLLHESLKINTFHLKFDRRLLHDSLDRRRNFHRFSYEEDPRFDKVIHFATTRHVEDLSLSYDGSKLYEIFLPEFLFNYAPLVKLRTRRCCLKPRGKVNWVSLKELKLVDCRFSDQAMEHIVSDSPLLEFFELTGCFEVNELVISSKSLKKLVLNGLYVDLIEISCPNLEELSIMRFTMYDPMLVDQAIECVLSNSLLLESFILRECHSLRRPAIASQSLRRLFMSNNCYLNGFEMCCQKLEDMKIMGDLNIMNIKLRNVPSSLCATLDFEFSFYRSTKETRKSFTEDILQQLQHVKELTIGDSIIEILTDFEVGGLLSLSPMLDIKCLILDRPYHCTLSRIAYFLQKLPILETLVVRLFLDDLNDDDEPKLDGFGENYWSHKAIGFDCLVSHLNTVKIYGIPRGETKPMHMLNFVQFLLNNARVLESMIVVLKENCRTDYTFKACQELFGFARCSKRATVELISE